MTEREPTNGELMHFINDIGKDMKDIKEIHLPEIKSNQRITNGTVADVKAWRERMIGAGYVAIAFMTIVVVPLLGWGLYQIAHFDDKIKEALSQYEKPSALIQQ